MRSTVALLLVLSLIVLPASAQVMSTPVEDVERALKSMVDAAGIAIPAEDAVLNFIAIMILYAWAAVRYVVGHAYILVWGQYIGLLCIYGYQLVKTGMEYIYVACSAFGRAFGCVPFLGALPYCVNGCLALVAQLREGWRHVLRVCQEVCLPVPLSAWFSQLSASS